eukprot:scaffold8900_cov119-Isochrysis_galbana.AAC.2
MPRLPFARRVAHQQLQERGEKYAEKHPGLHHPGELRVRRILKDKPQPDLHAPEAALPPVIQHAFTLMFQL